MPRQPYSTAYLEETPILISELNLEELSKC